MASGQELATAYLSLTVSARGINKDIQRELSGAESIAESAGRRMGSRIGDGIKTGAKVAGVAIAAILGTALTKGFGRLSAIENAQASLSGLGHSADTVSSIMKNALGAVKGTAFGMDEAASTAATAVAAGIKPGKELEGVLRLVGDAATIGGSTMTEMGAIFGKVATSNKVQGDVIAQLNDRGIPIVQMLGKQLGVTAEEVTKMAAKGEIGFDTFRAAMEDGLGGAALKSGETTAGAWKNMLAALSRIGAGLLGGVFPYFKTVFTGITGMLDNLEGKLTPLANAFGKELAGGIMAFGAAWKANDGDVTSSGFPGFMERVAYVGRQGFDELRGSIIAFHAAWVYNDGEVTSSGLPGFMERLGYGARQAFDFMRQAVAAFTAAWQYNDGEVTSSGFNGYMERAGYVARQTADALSKLDFSSWHGFTGSLSTAGGTIGNALGPALSSMGESLRTLAPAGKEFAKELPNIGGAVAKVAAGGLTVLTSVLGFLADHVDTIIRFMPLIVAGFVAWRVASLALASGTYAMQAAQLAMTPVTTLNTTLRLIAIRAENQQTAAMARNTLATHTNAAATIGQSAAQARTTLATKALALATGQYSVKMIASAIATKAHATATATWSAITKGAAAAQRVLNLALKANPIGLIITAIGALVAGLVWFFTQTEVGQKIVSAAWAGIKAAASAVFDWFTGTVLPGLSVVWEKISAGAMWLYDNGIKPAWEGIQAAVWAVAGWFQNTLAPAIKSVFDKVGAVFTWLYGTIIKPVFDLIAWYIGVWWTLIDGIFQVAVALFRLYVAPVFTWLWESVIKPVFAGIASTISTWWTGAQAIFNGVVGFVRGVFGTAFTWLRDSVVMPVFNGIATLVSIWWMRVSGNFNAAISFIRGVFSAAFTWLRDAVIQPVWNGITTAISVSWNFISGIFNAVVGFIRNTLATAFTWLRDNVISPVWNTIRDIVSSAWNNGIKPIFDTIADAVQNKLPAAFNAAKDGITTAWDKIKEAARKPVEFVVNKVINDGLIDTFNKIPGVDIKRVPLPPGFRKGGYTGDVGRDDVAGVVHGREYVFTAAQTAAIGKDKLAAIAASAGRSGAAATVGEGNMGGFFEGNAANIRRHGAYFLNVPASMAPWNFAGAARMWDGAAGVRVGVGRGQAQGYASSRERGGGILGYTVGNNIDMSPSWMARLGATQRRTVAAHEMGHALGLPHNSRSSIMQPNLANMASSPTAVDIRNLQALYPGGSGRAGSAVDNPFDGIVDKLMVQFKSAFPGGGMFIDAAGGLAKSGIGQVVQWVQDIKDGIKNIASDVVSSIRGFFGGGAATATVYDGGGWLERTGRPQLVQHNKSKPDAVLSSEQWGTMARIAANSAGSAGGITIQGDVYGATPEQIVDEWDTKQRRAATLNNLRKVVVS